MNLAISNIAWLQHEDTTVYSLMNKYGFTGLEIAPTRFFDNPYDTDTKEISSCKESIKANGIDVVAMQSLHFGKEGIALFENQRKRQALFEYTQKAIEFGAAVGAKALVFGSPKLRNSNNIDYDYRVGVDFFSKLGDVACEKGVSLLIEANPKQYNTNYINTTLEAFKLVEDVNSDGFGLHIDTSTMILNNTSDLSIVDRAIERIKHVHISSPFLHGVDEAHDKLFKNLANVLRINKYSKYVSIEMRRKEEGNISNIEKSLKYVREIFA